MLRFLLVPLVVIQLFMVFGYAADGSNSSEVGLGWDPNGSNGRVGSSPAGDIGPVWDPNG
jgi:hypothetical protein